MKASWSLALLFTACACADEAADRAAIERTIAALNEVPRRAALFSSDADAASELDRLRKAEPPVFRITQWPYPVDRPTVTISHEPWGEATIQFPGMGSVRGLEMINPRIVSRGIRFVTSDVALADGACVYQDASTVTQPTPLLFVMKKEGDQWKIAAVRIVEAH